MREQELKKKSEGVSLGQGSIDKGGEACLLLALANMGSNQLNVAIRHLRKLGAKENARKLPDRQLLARFVTERDEAAFEALVARHGQMVLNVCRRILHDPNAIEDAFQATFLVLVRKAGSIRKGELLGNWLYGVAYRTSARAKAESAKCRARESAAPARQQADPLDEITVRELFAALDEQLNRLPSAYRAPLVLCYLESKTRDEAAWELGCSLATLDRRLRRGRELLRTHLARHGLTLSVALFPVMLAQSPATACVPSTLVISTVKAAATVAAGSAAAGLVSAKVAALTEGVLKTMLISKLTTAFVFLTVGFLAVGGGLLTYHTVAAVPSGSPNSAIQERGKAKTDEEQLQGTWALISVESKEVRHALADTGLRELKYVFTGNKVIWKWIAADEREPQSGGPEEPVEFKLDSKKSPKELDMLHPKGTAKYLYRLDKDTLTMCFFGRSELGRPTQFSTKEGIEGNPIMWTLEREVPTKTGAKGAPKSSPEDAGTIGPPLGKYCAQIMSLAFTPDGKTLVTGGFGTENGEVKFWDVGGGKERLNLALPGLKRAVYCIDVTRDGTTLATAGWDGIIRLWDAKTAKEWMKLEGHQESRPGAPGVQVQKLRFSPDGKELVSASFDGQVLFWDVATGKQNGSLPRHPLWVFAVAYSPDGRRLARGADEAPPGDGVGRISQWRRATLDELHSLSSGRAWSQVYDIAYSPDGKSITAATNNSVACVWDADTGKEVRRFQGHTQGLKAVAFSPDDKTLATGGQDATVKLWDVTSGKELFTLAGHTAPVHSVVFSPDGKLLASGSADGTAQCRGEVKIWEVAAGREYEANPPGTDKNLLQDAGTGAAQAGKEKQDTKSGLKQLFALPDQLVKANKTDAEIVNALFRASLSRAPAETEKSFAAKHLKRAKDRREACRDILWALVNTKEFLKLHALDADPARALKLLNKYPDEWQPRPKSDPGSDRELGGLGVGEVGPTLKLDGHVASLAWSPDHKLIATRTVRFQPDPKGTLFDAKSGKKAKGFSTIQFWDANTQKLKHTLGEVELSGEVAIGFSPDSAVLAVSYRQAVSDKVELWDVNKESIWTTIEMEYGRVVPKFTFSPDGKTLAVIYGGSPKKFGGGARLFEVQTGKLQKTLMGHDEVAVSLAYSGDGKTLATGSYKGDIILWEGGKKTRTLEGGATPVTSVAFSPDGKTLAGGSKGGVMLWDWKTGKTLAGLEDAEVGHDLTFSRDGKLLAAVGPVEIDGKTKGQVRLWDITTKKVIRTWTDTLTWSCIAFSPDGETLAIGYPNGTIKLWPTRP